jgi:hypothetical protein
MAERSRDESNTLAVATGELSYCPRCADVYGALRGLGKRCGCPRSAGVTNVFDGGDFPTPFEVCWYCQVEIIRSGSKWSTYFCEECRIEVMRVNDWLASVRLVVLPIGRHSLMHARWPTARPFTTQELLASWKRRRLRDGWRSYPNQEDTDWETFAHSIRAARHTSFPVDVGAIALEIQRAKKDSVADLIREFNERRR